MLKKDSVVLVTGGAGFIGSKLCEKLTELGCKVISLDNYIMGSRDNPLSGVEYREGHTKDIATFVTEKIDVIFHLGEYSRIEVSFTEPSLVWDLNIAGTFGVVEFWRAQNSDHFCKLIYAGSSTKFADDGLGRNQSPYAWTKASNTELVCNYGEWFNLPFAVTYFYNAYGPGERSDKYGTVVEIFRQQFLRGEALTVVTPGIQRRNFTHVSDIVSGLLLVAERGEGDGFGLGSDESFTILEIAEFFGVPITMLPERQGNRISANLDTSKSRALGWRAEKNLRSYIESFL